MTAHVPVSVDQLRLVYHLVPQSGHLTAWLLTHACGYSRLRAGRVLACDHSMIRRSDTKVDRAIAGNPAAAQTVEVIIAALWNSAVSQPVGVQ